MTLKASSISSGQIITKLPPRTANTGKSAGKHWKHIAIQKSESLLLVPLMGSETSNPHNLNFGRSVKVDLKGKEHFALIASGIEVRKTTRFEGKNLHSIPLVDRAICEKIKTNYSQCYVPQCGHVVAMNVVMDSGSTKLRPALVLSKWYDVVRSGKLRVMPISRTLSKDPKKASQVKEISLSSFSDFNGSPFQLGNVSGSHFIVHKTQEIAWCDISRYNDPTNLNGGIRTAPRAITQALEQAHTDWKATIDSL